MDPFALVFWTVVIVMGVGVKLLILYWIYLAMRKVGRATKGLCIGAMDTFRKPKIVQVIHHIHVEG